MNAYFNCFKRSKTEFNLLIEDIAQMKCIMYHQDHKSRTSKHNLNIQSLTEVINMFVHEQRKAT